jgi:hypothetical protein
MHGSIDIIGPGAIVVLVLFFAIWGTSLYVAIDSLRRPPVDYTGVREGRWFYAAPQGLYFIAFGLMQLPFVSGAVPWLGQGVVIALVPVLAQQIAYLLRVVFPTRARLEARREAKDRALADEFGVAYDDVGLDGEPDSGTQHDSDTPSA